MTVKDRTQEFHACVESIRSSSHGRNTHQERLLNGNSVRTKGEFMKTATAIGKDINQTAGKLQKLAQLAKRKTLFDDRPVEISELTFIIKQDIAKINQQIALLQTYSKEQKGRSGKGDAATQEHNNNVVVLLQSKLASTSMSFKDVLETRTQNMKASKERTEQFMYSTGGANPNPSVLRSRKPRNPYDPPSPILPSTDAPLLIGSQRNALANGRSSTADEKKDFLALDMGDTSNPYGAHQQMQLVDQQDQYIETRSSAIESIESTIAELGGIFGQLAQMVAEQRDTVQRIDANTEDIVSNVSGAQRELLKYYSSVTSNRMLMLKIFGVLIVFFLLLVLLT